MDFFLGLSIIIFLVPFNLVTEKMYTRDTPSDVPVALGMIVVELLICSLFFVAMALTSTNIIMTLIGFGIGFLSGGMLLKIHLALKHS